MKIEKVKIEDLKMYENNPRRNDEAVQSVKKSIEKFGFKVPIIIDKNNVIVAGHTRYKASKELGIKELPCIVADDLNEEQIKAFRLADNKVAEKSKWDFEKLTRELEEIDFDMDDFDFTIDKYVVDDIFSNINDNNYERTTRFEHKLKIDRQEIIMTDDEYERIINVFNDYVNENGVSFGFVNYILGGNNG